LGKRIETERKTNIPAKMRSLTKKPKKKNPGDEGRKRNRAFRGILGKKDAGASKKRSCTLGEVPEKPTVIHSRLIRAGGDSG